MSAMSSGVPVRPKRIILEQFARGRALHTGQTRRRFSLLPCRRELFTPEGKLFCHQRLDSV